jgi:hypothetical protein
MRPSLAVRHKAPCITKATDADTKANGDFIRLRQHAAQPYDASSASLPTTR